MCDTTFDRHPAFHMDTDVKPISRKDSDCATLLQLHAAGPDWRTAEIIIPTVAKQEEVDTEREPKGLPEESPVSLAQRRRLEKTKLQDILNLSRPFRRPPRVLYVSRRYLRKNKYVDIAGEYHLELIQDFGGMPVLIPRTTNTLYHLAEYLPMDGLVIAEGNDMSDDILLKYGCQVPGRLDSEAAQKYAGDTEFDLSKDELEFALMRFALAAGCPILTFCRGCQMLNVMRGGTLIGDIDTEVNGGIAHLRDSGDPDYDTFRHPINVVPSTPLAEWFADSLSDTNELQVNSYHHQACKTLGDGLVEMAKAPDGITEAFCDTDYAPAAGRFVVGLQFHPERMLSDYPGCGRVYHEFGRACHAYKARQESLE